MRIRTIALILLALLVPAVAQAAEALRSISVVGTQFRVTTESGKVLPQEALIGAVLSYADEAGHPTPVRIDRIERDPKDASGEILLYGLSVQNAGGQWGELCAADPDGVQAGFPVQVGPSKEFVLTCTSGAQGKCVRFGYKPWAKGSHDETLLPYWQACLHMVRADYCGDGTPHTKDGTTIDMFDPLGIQKDEAGPGMEFEAAWLPDGAVCVPGADFRNLFARSAARGMPAPEGRRRGRQLQ